MYVLNRTVNQLAISQIFHICDTPYEYNTQNNIMNVKNNRFSNKYSNSASI